MSDSSEPVDIPSIHPEMYIGVSLLAFFLSSFCLSLRVYVRAILIKSFGVDDWLLVSAWVVVSAHALLMMSYGIRIHREGLENNAIFATAIIEFQGWLYHIGQTMIKAAFAAFILHVLPVDGWQRPALWTTFALFAAYNLAYGFISLYQCGDPLTSLEDPDPVCLSLDALGICTYVSCVLNMVTDWMFTLLPTTVIVRTTMARRTKFSVVGIMMLGGFASILSIIRIPLVAHSVFSGWAGFSNVTAFIMVSFWENVVGVMAVALAACRPLMRQIFNETPQGTSDASSKAVMAEHTIGGGRAMDKNEGFTVTERAASAATWEADVEKKG
ncbi:hypothetical protein B9Z65_3766 [Elsinoe australis]|uniref:Rhodopsin domain-containing protein n=1 Tax=Elsinoe australis TaxID=40998 RepID=A0A2P8AG52_9PEZI|nr:hypothetical protein B9Z65_3766 [Elsinoe australis]